MLVACIISMLYVSLLLLFFSMTKLQASVYSNSDIFLCMLCVNS